MKRRGIMFLVVSAATLIGAWALFEYMEPRVAKLYGGSKWLAVVSHPEQAEAYRIERTYAYGDPLENFPIIAGPVSVPADLAARISNVLVSEDSYVWDEYKACEPVPGVRISFLLGDDQVDVLLCFECNILIVYRNGTFTGAEDFDPVRPELVRAVKPLFPDDEVIQQLQERG